MLVISDASALNVLVRLDLSHILSALWEKVMIPDAVAEELADLRAPEKVRSFMAMPPTWLVIRKPVSLLPLPGLGPGERAAISLAHESKADLLLIDDKRGRRVARDLGIPITGTLGVLERGAKAGLVDLSQAVVQLRATDFKVAEKLLQEALRRDKERRSDT